MTIIQSRRGFLRGLSALFIAAPAIVRAARPVACSAVKYGVLIYMKFAFDNGDISTVLLDPAGSFHFLRALKALVPDTEHIGASHVTNGEIGPQVQEGHMSV